MINKLAEKGFVIFKNILNNNLNLLQSSIHDNEYIDNNIVKEFIDNHIITNIDKKFKWSSNYSKFRFSNYQNLTDADAFHANIYNFSDNTMPIYTTICYLDNAQIEIVPGTHIDGQ